MNYEKLVVYLYSLRGWHGRCPSEREGGVCGKPSSLRREQAADSSAITLTGLKRVSMMRESCCVQSLTRYKLFSK